MNTMHYLNGKTQVYAVIGDPISHSLSPIMHNAAFNFFNIDSVYIACHVYPNELSHAVKAFNALNFKGVNVTVPYKQTIKPFLDEVIGDSIKTGSVNTIINQNGRLIGTSTDGIGFIQSLRKDGGFDPSGKKVILLGAGGTALALSYQLILSSISSLVCVNRTLPNAENLKSMLLKSTGFKIDVKSLSQLSEIDFTTFDILVNTTSFELSEDTSILSKEYLNPGIFVYDVVYKKEGTRLLKVAQETGCRILDGLSLLVYQGAESFRLWFDREPPIKIMKDALHRYVQSV